MARASDLVFLFSVAALSVVVLGAAESGVGPATGVPGVSSQVTSIATQTSQSISLNETTVVESTSARTTTVVGVSVTRSVSVSSVPGTNGIAAGLSLEEVAWYILIPAVVCLAGGMVAVLIRKEKPRIFDLKALTEEMESQQDYFASGWSKKLRNAALLRYYVLMVQACAKLGIEDSPTDTPREFIGRASEELNVKGADAGRFADVVDRAHYGAELSGDEVDSASKFMNSFTKVILGRAGID